jgi:resuscitation-promoting factor RpfB
MEEAALARVGASARPAADPDAGAVDWFGAATAGDGAAAPADDALHGPTSRFAARPAAPAEPATRTEPEPATGPIDVTAAATGAHPIPPQATGRFAAGAAVPQATGTHRVAGAVEPVDLAEPAGIDDADTHRFPAVAPAAGRRRRAAATARSCALARAGVVAALVALLGSGATALAMDKTVTLVVDGSERTLHTFAADVGSALAAVGMVPTPQDRISPAPPTELVDGDEIVVERGRLLTLVEGGSERRVWTTADSVDEALRGLGVEVEPRQVSAAPAALIPLAGMSLELRIPREVTLADGTAAPVPVTTTAGTVGALLAERGVQLGPDDVAVPSGDTPLTDGTAVQVVRNGIGEVVETREIPPPEQVVEDPGMPRGEKEVVEEGRPGEQMSVMRVHVQNGQEVRREQVRAGGMTPPEPRVVRVGTKEPTAEEEAAAAEEEAAGDGEAPAVSDRATWERLAQCESTGDWSINTGNGYYGGLQFNARTWRAYGGDAYAPLPHQATPEEQMAVATKMRDDRGGYGAWPACARKLGLPR